MILNFEKYELNTYVSDVLKKFPNTYFLIIDGSVNYKQVLTNLLTTLKKDKSKNILFVASLKEFTQKKESIGQKKIKKFVKLIGNKGYKVNYLRIGEILEDPLNLVNKKIEQVTKYKKAYFSTENKKYYYISEIDLEKGVKKINESPVFGKVFNFSLNKINEEKILTTLESVKKFKKEIVTTKSTTNKLINPSFKTLQLINFKPEVTIKTYIKRKLQETNKESKKLKLKLKWSKKYILCIILLLITWVTLSFADFVADNYYLLTNVKELNAVKISYYANKLRKINLPTKYGENYNNFYNAAYYGSNAIELIEKKDKQSAYESLAKSVEFAKNIKRENFLTPTEKQYYEKIKPLLEEIEYNKGYITFIDLLELSKKELNLIVLIQNSNELRTSGGFVGSFAVVSTKDLKIKNVKFDDIYNVDGVLNEKHKDILLKTPQEYKSFIKTDFLFARDLNILLDDNVKNTAYINYFEQALNINVDGIVYLDLGFIKNLLQVTGPIYLANYKETVTPENFDTLAQIHSEQNYYEGSSQKANFLSLLGGRALEIIKEKKLYSPTTLATILKSINNKNVQVFLKDLRDQSLIENSGLYENLYDLKNKEFIYILENNLGENKVNKLTEKNVEYNINYDIRRGVKITDITVKIKNNSKDYTFPYGAYKGILSIVTPPNMLITKTIALDNGKEIDVANIRTISNFGNLAVIDIPFAVKPKEETTIKVSFEEEKPSYDKVSPIFYVIKQPGAKEYDLKINLNIPDKISIEKEVKVYRDLTVTLK